VWPGNAVLASDAPPVKYYQQFHIFLAPEMLLLRQQTEYVSMAAASLLK
jgi:hypothetical protein